MASARDRTGVGRGTQTGLAVDSKAEAVAELMLEVAQCFFRIRAVGQKTGLITSWGGGAFGFIRSLALLGPLTVPQIAQMRPTSRELNARFLAIASTLGVALSEADIRRTTEIVRQLSDDVKHHSVNDGGPGN